MKADDEVGARKRLSVATHCPRRCKGAAAADYAVRTGHRGSGGSGSGGGRDRGRGNAKAAAVAVRLCGGG